MTGPSREAPRPASRRGSTWACSRSKGGGARNQEARSRASSSWQPCGGRRGLHLVARLDLRGRLLLAQNHWGSPHPFLHKKLFPVEKSCYSKTEGSETRNTRSLYVLLFVYRDFCANTTRSSVRCPRRPRRAFSCVLAGSYRHCISSRNRCRRHERRLARTRRHDHSSAPCRATSAQRRRPTPRARAAVAAPQRHVRGRRPRE